MVELILMRGIAGSGKSTWARRWVASGLDRVRVSRDDIRLAMFGTVHNVDEEAVSDIEDAMIRAALGRNKSVVVDDTNITARFARRSAALGFEAGADVRIQQIDVSLETALAQNAARVAAGGRDVPEDVIRKMYQRITQTPVLELDFPTIVPYVADTTKPAAFLFDVDGTLARMNRSPYDYARVGEDEVVEAVAEVARCLAFSHKIIVMSGRDGVAYEDTFYWLYKHDITFDQVFMRAKGDGRKDTVVKYELFNDHVRDHYNVVGVVDDRPSVCRMWRTLGLATLQVGDPHKEF